MDYNQLRKILIWITWSGFGFFNTITITEADLSVVFTDIDVSANPKYIAPDYEVFILDEGVDNQVFINLTFIKSPPIESSSYFKVLAATMGEYKINTGFEYYSKFCDLADEPIFFGRLRKQLGIGSCPLKIGTYVTEAYEIDFSTLPENFPPNKYLCTVNFETDEGEFILNFSLYVVVQ